MGILVGYETMHSRHYKYNMNIFDGLQGTPRNTTDFRPILVLLSTRSTTKLWSHLPVANRKPTRLVDLLPKAAPQKPKLRARESIPHCQKDLI